MAAALGFGYSGSMRKPLEELLRRAGLSWLLLVSPTGAVPYGGRSDAFNFAEPMLAVLFELEALYKINQRLAGALSVKPTFVYKLSKGGLMIQIRFGDKE